MSEKSPNIPNITNVPQVLGFRADNPLLSDLRDTCTHYGISRSRLVRLLVADGLQRLSYGRCRTLEKIIQENSRNIETRKILKRIRAKTDNKCLTTEIRED